jgi:hypothetical protein
MHTERLKMKTAKTLLSALIVAGACVPMVAQAQVVREDGVKSIAGVFYTAAGNPTQAEWTFRSTGGQILFASLDADIYRESSEHGDGETVVAAAEGGGCSDEEGGPGLFKLKVFDAYGTEPICSASRPAPPPGWMRDARLACEITSPGTYRLQVKFTPPDDGEQLQNSYPFLLNISLRKIAPTGTNIQSAIAASSASGF